MKTKQIFSIMVLVGIAFAGIAFAGPIGGPLNSNTFTPIYASVSSLASSDPGTVIDNTNSVSDQSKIGSTPTGVVGGMVAHALALGIAPFPSYDTTLYVNGQMNVGSLNLAADPLQVNTSMNVIGSLNVQNTTVVTNTNQVSNLTTTKEVFRVGGLAGAGALCADGAHRNADGSSRVIPCPTQAMTNPATNPVSILSFTKSGNNNLNRMLTWTSKNATSCLLDRTDPSYDPALLSLVLAPNSSRPVVLISNGDIYELTCTNGASTDVKYLLVN